MRLTASEITGEPSRVIVFVDCTMRAWSALALRSACWKCTPPVSSRISQSPFAPNVTAISAAEITCGAAVPVWLRTSTPECPKSFSSRLPSAISATNFFAASVVAVSPLCDSMVAGARVSALSIRCWSIASARDPPPPRRAEISCAMQRSSARANPLRGAIRRPRRRSPSCLESGFGPAAWRSRRAAAEKRSAPAGACRVPITPPSATTRST